MADRARTDRRRWQRGWLRLWTPDEHGGWENQSEIVLTAKSLEPYAPHWTATFPSTPSVVTRRPGRRSSRPSPAPDPDKRIAPVAGAAGDDRLKTLIASAR
ncbi:hypothetical protein AB0C27_28360 [Nonomuraea sp. NPDC048882]|uniref:hypothetical protein n=1 Tax=Nonomuraea sp. NPDC048882 TaxID=3154347 RepID=UPI000A6819A9